MREGLDFERQQVPTDHERRYTPPAPSQGEQLVRRDVRLATFAAVGVHDQPARALKKAAPGSGGGAMSIALTSGLVTVLKNEDRATRRLTLGGGHRLQDVPHHVDEGKLDRQSLLQGMHQVVS